MKVKELLSIVEPGTLIMIALHGEDCDYGCMEAEAQRMQAWFNERILNTDIVEIRNSSQFPFHVIVRWDEEGTEDETE